MEFFNLLPPAEAVHKFLEKWKPSLPDSVRTSLEEAGGRVLAEDIRVETDLPAFARSTVDGFAVRAGDTFGATETSPALFTIIGEIGVGKEASVHVVPGTAARIATGAMIPPGADAVVMVEYTEDLGCGMLAVLKDVAPGENVVSRGEDLCRGEILLKAGHRLKAQDIGALAALGRTEVLVYRRPTVLVLSTGDEIVPPGTEPALGQVRDTNGPALVAAVKACGCEVRFGGVVRDDYEELVATVRGALDKGVDGVILSGGSSVGPHDLAPRVINALGGPGVIVHGLAIKPGKPTILGLAGSIPVFGLPGHPASALVVFDVVVEPLLRALAGEDLNVGESDTLSRGPALPERPYVAAVLDRNLPSTPGREDYYRVRLVSRDGVLHAVPVLGKSGLISTLVRAEGLVKVPLESGGIEAGELVKVMLWTF